jgi:predicted outer membrane protein
MLRKILVPVVVSMFISGAAFAAPPAVADQTSVQQGTKLSDSFSVLHAVGRWAINLSEMAEQHAKSDLVKNYARSMATANSTTDQKLLGVAQKHKLDIVPMNPETEQGKSLLDRMQAETVMLGSLQGDAFDKEYMTLVTNTQQSVIRVLDTKKAIATDPEVKQLLGDMAAAVRNRLQTAQDIMAKVYADTI